LDYWVRLYDFLFCSLFDIVRHRSNSNSYGIILGLLFGKPLGIFIFSVFDVAIGLCSIPKEIRKKHLIGVGLFAGIGFTMSIFITLLAFGDKISIVNSKISIVIVLAGSLGFL